MGAEDLEEGAHLVLPDRVLSPGRLVIDGDRIVEVGPGRDDGPLAGLWVVPGFIDVHVHGLLGTDVLDATDSVGKVAERMPRFGCTSFTPTTFACPPAAIERLVCAPTMRRAIMLRPRLSAPRM